MTRFAIIQPGRQVEALLRVAQRLRGGSISAVVDSDAVRAKQWAATLGGVVWTTSAQELHEQHDGQFDAWVVPTPAGMLVAPHNHQPVRSAPEAWLDLPAGWLWGQVYRFLPSVAAIRQSIDTGQLGAPGLVRLHHWQSHSVGDARPALTAQLDVASWLIGERPTTLLAIGRHANAAVAAYSTVNVHLGFADDRMALVESSTGLDDHSTYFTLSVIGSTGAAYIDDQHNTQLVFRGGQTLGRRTTEDDAALLAMLHEYIDSQHESRPPRCGADQWRRATRLAAAVERSLASHEAVTLDGDEVS